MAPGRSGGTGGQGRRRLAGKGATPPAERRPGHPAQRRKAAAERSAAPRASSPVKPPTAGAAPRTSPAHESGRGPQGGPPRRRDAEMATETVVGRNPVAEALTAGVPARALQVVLPAEADPRIDELLRLAAARGVPVIEVGRRDLDRITAGAVHQGVALSVPPYRYQHPRDVFDRALLDPATALVVALDGVTDPRNLGAIARSAAAFGAQGLVVAQRRAAGVSAGSWKSSAGALARLPVAQATNMARALREAAAAGFTVVGLQAHGEMSVDALDLVETPVVLVVGGERRGLGRVVGEACDVRVRIPIAAGVESLNASVATAVVLAEIARQRRVTSQ